MQHKKLISCNILFSSKPWCYCLHEYLKSFSEILSSLGSITLLSILQRMLWQNDFVIMLLVFQLRLKTMQWHLLTCSHGSPSQSSQKDPTKRGSVLRLWCALSIAFRHTGPARSLRFVTHRFCTLPSVICMCYKGCQHPHTTAVNAAVSSWSWQPPSSLHTFCRDEFGTFAFTTASFLQQLSK